MTHCNDFCGVYMVVNKVNGKVYVGSSKQVRRRISAHVSALRRGSHHSAALQRAVNKYGLKSFEAKPVVICSPESRLFYEQLLLDGYKANDPAHGYNMTKYAHCPTPLVYSEDQRKAISERLRRAAKKHHYCGEMLSLMEIAERSGIPPKTLMSRVSDGMSAEDAAKIPLRRSRALLIEIDGQTKKISEWRKHYGIDAQSVNSRLHLGWDIKAALTTPVAKAPPKFTHMGETLSLTQWAKKAGIPQQTLSNRVNRFGWDFVTAITRPPSANHKDRV